MNTGPAAKSSRTQPSACEIARGQAAGAARHRPFICAPREGWSRSAFSAAESPSPRITFATKRA
jgi:hypothetical protein